MEREINVRVQTEEQLQNVLEWDGANRVFVDAALFYGARKIHANTLKCLENKAKEGKCSFFISLPDVAREKSIAPIREILTNTLWIQGAIVKNLDELGILQEINYPGEVIADAFLYTYNREAAAFYQELFPQITYICSDELTDRELWQMAKQDGMMGRMIYKIYGYQQLMVTAQCLSRNYTGCQEKVLSFQDEKGERFYAFSECSSCSSRIYNGKPTYMLDKWEEAEWPRILVEFTLEQGDAVRKILRIVDQGTRGEARATSREGFEGKQKGEDPQIPSKYAGKQKGTLPEKPGQITRGHHYVGID